MTQITLKNEEAQFNALKKQATDIAEQCNLICITDEITLGIANQQLSQLNATIKNVDALHKQVKEIHLKNCQAIDGLRKTLHDPMASALINGKNKILAWNNEVKRIAMEKQNRIIKITNAIKDYSNDAIAEMDNCKTMEELREVRERLVVNHPGAEKWFEFLPNFLETRNTLNEYAKSVKTRILTPAQADKDETIAIAEVIQEANNQIGTEALAETVVTKLKGSRSTWKWKVYDIESVPFDWLMVDKEEVNEYIRNHKDILVDNGVNNGIQFYIEETLTIR